MQPLKMAKVLFTLVFLKNNLFSSMKICLTMHPQKTAFGGGNQFALNLVNYLEKSGVKVVYELEPGINTIFIMDPRILKFNKIDLPQIINYKKNNPNVKVIHRVNDCDKPRGEIDNLDKHLMDAFKIDDLIIFVSDWTKNYFIKEKKCDVQKKSIVINNGCNRNYFYPNFQKKLSNKIKIITHHWSSNAFKGKDIYIKLDEWIKDKDYEFIYIGREFPGTPKNSKVIGPFFGLELANHIREGDIYISASQWENCPMHVVEAFACGLPVLYYENIGGGVEIGKAHGGESFKDFEELTQKLEIIKNNYDEYRKKINHKILDGDLCSKKYTEEILKLK